MVVPGVGAVNGLGGTIFVTALIGALGLLAVLFLVCLGIGAVYLAQDHLAARRKRRRRRHAKGDR